MEYLIRAATGPKFTLFYVNVIHSKEGSNTILILRRAKQVHTAAKNIKIQTQVNLLKPPLAII